MNIPGKKHLLYVDQIKCVDIVFTQQHHQMCYVPHGLYTGTAGLCTHHVNALRLASLIQWTLIARL